MLRERTDVRGADRDADRTGGGGHADHRAALVLDAGRGGCRPFLDRSRTPRDPYPGGPAARVSRSRATSYLDRVPAYGRFVELEAKPWRLRRNQISILQSGHRFQDAGRAGDVFDQVTVRDRAQQVDLDLGHHVTAHRHPMRLRERGDLSPGGDAANSREIEDDDVDGAGFQRRLEGVEVIQV